MCCMQFHSGGSGRCYPAQVGQENAKHLRILWWTDSLRIINRACVMCAVRMGLLLVNQSTGFKPSDNQHNREPPT